MEELSMGARLSLAETIHDDLQGSSAPSSSDKYQGDVKKALNIFLQIHQWVESESLFSSNEELSEYSTSDIKFALVPFYIGDLMLLIAGVY